MHLVLQNDRWCFVQCLELFEAPSSPLSFFSVSWVCHTGTTEIIVDAERLQREQLLSLELYDGISGCDGEIMS